MEFVLEAIGITKKFPGVLANDNVSLNVKPGEILGLIGENGAGNLRSLKCLTASIPAATPAFAFDGKEIQPSTPMTQCCWVLVMFRRK